MPPTLTAADLAELVQWLRAQLDEGPGETREADADRGLIADYLSAQETVDAAAHPDMYDVGRAQGLEDAILRRATAYADRPGYREEWRS